MLLVLLFLLGTGNAWAQGPGKQVLKFTADTIQGRTVGGERINTLISNVVIKQDKTTIRADSAAVMRAQNRAEAYGRIRVQEGDSIDITSKSLIYDGNTGTAHMYRDVVYRDGSTTLFTDNLQFNKFTGISSYYEGGRMMDNGNELTSQRGTFDRPNQNASFFW